MHFRCAITELRAIAVGDALRAKAGPGRIFLVTDAVRAIRPDEGERLMHEWAQRGVRMVTSASILEAGLLDSSQGQRTIGYPT